MSRLLTAFLSATVLAAVLAGSTSARDLPVSDGAGLAAALSRAVPGDVIRLTPGIYPKLKVENRQFSGPVRIVGAAGVQLGGLALTGSSNVTFENLTITPTDPGRDAGIIPVDGSSAIVFDHVRFVGAPTAGVELDIGRDTQDVRVSGSEFTVCRAQHPCLQPGGQKIAVLSTRFHDCSDCDMVRGGGSDVTFDGDVFERALKGSGGNHNDLIQIMGGGPWTITRNRFGDHQGGAAQVFANPANQNATNPIHDLTIESNVFTGQSGYAVFIGAGQKSIAGAARNVRIVNNTILSGKTGALRIGDPFANLPPAERPLVANNILGVSTGVICGLTRSSHNLVLSGSGCPADVVGDAKLDATGAPTTVSSLIIDRADPTVAPATDFYGHARRGLPDIGAIEFGGLSAVPLRLTAPARMTLRLHVLRSRHWIVTVRVGVTGADRLRARLLRGNKIVASSTRTVAGKTGMVVSLKLPVSARRTGALKLTLLATAKDGSTAAKAVRVTLLR